MLHDQSKLRLARNDTLLSRSDDIDQLSMLYGAPLAQTHIEDEFKRLLARNAQYAVKGSYTQLLSLLTNYYRYAQVQVAGTFTTTSTGASFQSNSLTAAWGENRLVRLHVGNDSYLLNTQSFDSANSTIHFIAAETTKFESRTSTQNTTTTATATLYAFRILEKHNAPNDTGTNNEQCTVVIDVITPNYSYVPASYYRVGDAVNQGEPFGLHVLDLFSSTDNHRMGNQQTGAYPLYYDGDTIPSNVIEFLKLQMVAGVKLKMRPRSTYGV